MFKEKKVLSKSSFKFYLSEIKKHIAGRYSVFADLLKMNIYESYSMTWLENSMPALSVLRSKWFSSHYRLGMGPLFAESLVSFRNLKGLRLPLIVRIDVDALDFTFLFHRLNSDGR